MLKKPSSTMLAMLLSILMLVVALSGCGAKEDPKGLVSGKIYDDTTKELITGSVVVTLSGAPTITVTNGQYQFAEVPAGNITLTAQSGGYQAYIASVNVQAGQTTVKDIYLAKYPSDLAAGDRRTYAVGRVYFAMCYAPNGSFVSDDSVITGDDSLPSQVDVANSFWIAETEVTYELWHKVYIWATTDGHGYTFANPGREGNDGVIPGVIPADPTDDAQEPVTTISWRDALVWCNALTEYYNAENAASLDCVYKTTSGDPIRDANAGTICDAVVPDPTAKGFRLPTSGEWQLAARYQDGATWTLGGHVSGDTGGPCYSTNPKMDPFLSKVFGNYAWYIINTTSTQPVGQKLANALEVRDMTGNVYEWCFDLQSGYLSRFYRGGSYDAVPLYLRIGYVRFGNVDSAKSYLGFRFVRTY